jgi:hypothetical protein
MQQLSAVAASSPNFTITSITIPSPSCSFPVAVDAMGETGPCPAQVLLQIVGTNTLVESELGRGSKIAPINRPG